MPGIAGILDSENRIDSHELLDRMCNAVRHESWHKEDRHIDPPIAIGLVHLGILNPEPQPVFNEDRSLWIIMEGEIYDYEREKRSLEEKGHVFSTNNDPEFALHMYEEYGEDFAQQLNGQFNLAIFDRRRKRLLIANDRFGQRPLYYAEYNGRLLIASEVKGILADEAFDKVIDDFAVSNFITLGYILGCKTYFRGIKLLPPASLLVHEEGKTSLKRYWDIQYIDDYKTFRKHDYIEECSHLLARAVDRRMQGNHEIGTTLSGGLDTRTIIANIDRTYYPIHTFTYGEYGCSDSLLAEEISALLGSDHHFFELEPDYLIKYAHKAVYLTDGMYNYIHSRGVKVTEEMVKYINICFHGGQPFDHPLSIRSVNKKIPSDAGDELILPYVWFALPLEVQKALFTDSYYPKVENSLPVSIQEIQPKQRIDSAFNRLHYYYMRNMLIRFCIPDTITFRNTIETRFPLLDNDLVDFVLTVPPKLMRDKYILAKVFVRFFPELAEIAYQRTGLPLTAGKFRSKLHHAVGKGLKPYKRKVFKGLRKLTGKNLTPERRYHWAWERWFSKDMEFQNFARETLLSEQAKSRGYFKSETVERALREQEHGLADNSQLIGRLLTFEIWNKLFIDGESWQ